MSTEKKEIIIELMNREMPLLVEEDEVDNTMSVVNRLQALAKDFTDKYQIDDEAYLALMLALTVAKDADEVQRKLQSAEDYIAQIESTLTTALT